jgi:hypothetical protein
VFFPRERHEQRHKDNDIFQCEDCNKVFKNEKNLRHHYKAHHENPSPGEVSTYSRARSVGSLKRLGHEVEWSLVDIYHENPSPGEVSTVGREAIFRICNVWIGT